MLLVKTISALMISIVLSKSTVRNFEPDFDNLNTINKLAVAPIWFCLIALLVFVTSFLPY